MARYDYRCPLGHVNEMTFPIARAPNEFICFEPIRATLCNEVSIRLLATGTSFIINKVMSPPSQRLKPGHIGV